MWKIMLAEDEPLLRKAIKKILSENPEYEICFEASNGATALEYLASHKADILISDIRMPSIDGLELIKQIYEKGIKVKVIVLSGYNDFEYARHMLKYDAFTYLLKPIDPAELLKTLEKACEKIKLEEINNSILKSHKFRNFQRDGYAHFTNEMPNVLLNSKNLASCCIDFEKVPSKECLVIWQLDLEKELYPCCCFWLDSYLYIVYDKTSYDVDSTELITEIQMYFEKKNTSIRMGVGLTVDSMLKISTSMKQARKALHYYQRLPYHEIVYYKRISLLENHNNTSYPLLEEKKLLDAVTNVAKEDNVDIHKCMRSFCSLMEHQSTELIYLNLIEFVFSIKRELSQYHLHANWDDLYYAIQNRKMWKDVVQQIETTLIACHSKLISARTHSNAHSISKAKQYIRNNYSRMITLDEVAQFCYLSKSHFCKIFKEETGMTFKTYLNQIRIESAKTLLKTTSLKSYEISEKIGFDDSSYFNELFKKIVGMTPNEFRNVSSASAKY